MAEPVAKFESRLSQRYLLHMCFGSNRSFISSISFRFAKSATNYGTETTVLRKFRINEAYQLAMYLLDQYRGTVLSCRYAIPPRLAAADSRTRLEGAVKVAVVATKRSDQSRQFSWLVTNVGVLDGDTLRRLSTTGGDTKSDNDQRWSIDRTQFGLSAEIPAAAIEFAPISVVGQGMCVGADWPDCAVDTMFGERIMADLERWLTQLVTQCDRKPGPKQLRGRVHLSGRTGAAISIDLGSSEWFIHIEEAEFLCLLDICCDPWYHLEGHWYQMVMGLVNPLARSLELPEVLERPLFAHFSQVPGRSGSSGSGVDSARLFRQVESAASRAQVVVEALSMRLARTPSIQLEDVDMHQALHAYGVDSLIAVELRSWLGKEFGADVPVFEIVSGKTIKSVANLVAKILIGQIKKRA
ncbi:hypothetical protein F4804DRAFT_335624 [Jackrogersella minutella]|nr:hypothetical protein F4804DRAFT_335624 [Jackrogersella minutella]